MDLNLTNLLAFITVMLAATSFLTLQVPDEGEQRMLELVVNKTAQANLTLHLYSNNVTPGDTNVLADFTECTGGGYASVTLTGASWTVTAGTGTPASASYAEQTFTWTSVPGVTTVYGYFVKNGTKVLWAERLPAAPFTIAAAGDNVKITPVITLKDAAE